MSVAVDLGTIPANGSATVGYEALVPVDLAPFVTTLTNQGLVTGDNFPDVPTDDPVAPGVTDPTVLVLEPGPAIEIPTLGTWSMLLLAAFLGLTGLFWLRRG